MNPNEIIFGSILAVILVGMAVFFSWRQLIAVRTLRTADDLTPEDRLYTRQQVTRRLLCSALMVVLAGLLVGSFFVRQPIHVEPPDEEQQRIFNTFTFYWIVTLLVLLAIIALAALDFFAIRHYGQRHYRKIQADRRAMIEDQLIRLRSQRNGHG